MKLELLPELDTEQIASSLRAARQRMSILEMQRRSGVDRQVLYRLMGGTSIQRTPYEIVVKVVKFLYEEGGGKKKAPVVPKEPVAEPVAKPESILEELPPVLNISVLK